MTHISAIAGNETSSISTNFSSDSIYQVLAKKYGFDTDSIMLRNTAKEQLDSLKDYLSRHAKDPDQSLLDTYRKINSNLLDKHVAILDRWVALLRQQNFPLSQEQALAVLAKAVPEFTQAFGYIANVSAQLEKYKKGTSA